MAKLSNFLIFTLLLVCFIEATLQNPPNLPNIPGLGDAVSDAECVKGLMKYASVCGTHTSGFDPNLDPEKISEHAHDKKKCCAYWKSSDCYEEKIKQDVNCKDNVLIRAAKANFDQTLKNSDCERTACQSGGGSGGDNNGGNGGNSGNNGNGSNAAYHQNGVTIVGLTMFCLICTVFVHKIFA